MSPSLSFNKRAWQYVQTEKVNGEDVYIFGELDQVTTSLTTRLSYTFTPDLSLQLYAEPFISAGDYDNFMAVADPRAAKFDARFRSFDVGQLRDFSNPDFNFRALRSTAVLRWEYRPGSALFLVWSQGREHAGQTGDYRFGRDTEQLFGAPATNVLLIKGTYWLGL